MEEQYVFGESFWQQWDLLIASCLSSEILISKVYLLWIDKFYDTGKSDIVKNHKLGIPNSIIISVILLRIDKIMSLLS